MYKIIEEVLNKNTKISYIELDGKYYITMIELDTDTSDYSILINDSIYQYVAIFLDKDTNSDLHKFLHSGRTFYCISELCLDSKQASTFDIFENSNMYDYCKTYQRITLYLKKYKEYFTVNNTYVKDRALVNYLSDLDFCNIDIDINASNNITGVVASYKAMSDEITLTQIIDEAKEIKTVEFDERLLYYPDSLYLCKANEYLLDLAYDNIKSCIDKILHNDIVGCCLEMSH